MKKLIYCLTLFLCAISLRAQGPPTTGQFLFQQKPSSGPFTQFGVTPVTNQVFGWDGTKVVMLSPGGGISWGSITGTLASQTDLQAALNARLTLTGTLALANFGSITGILPVGNLPGTVQYTNGALALGSFSSITGTLADARLSSNVQLKNGALALSGFSNISGTISTANLPATIPDGNLSSNVQLKNGALAIAGFSSVTGQFASGNIGDLSATYLTLSLAASDYQPLNADLTALAALSGTNNIYYRSAAHTWTSVGIGNGLSFSGGTLAASNTGSVTSVALTAPGIFSVSGSPVTSSGTIALSLASESTNFVFAGPVSGGATTPAFRALVANDLPDLSGTYLTTSAATSGYQPLSGNLTALAATSGSNNIYYRSGTNTWSTVAIGSGLTFTTGTLASTAGGGSVTSVGLSLPGIFSLSGSPVTTSGTISASLANQSVNTFFAGPASGSSTTPTFRTIVTSDIPDLSATYLTPATAAADYQPLAADLTALAALGGTNTIYYRSAAHTWSAVTVGSGLSFTTGSLTATTAGTVSSVSLSLPGMFSVTGNPVTTSGTITGSLVAQNAKSFFSGPTSGSASSPTFRVIAATDIPDISASYLTPAAATAAYQPLAADLTSLAGASATSSLFYRVSSGTWAPVTISGNLTLSGGTLSSSGVTSVALTAPSIFTVSGSPITTSGTLAFALNVAPPNQFFSGPSSGSAATPTFRVLTTSDIPSLSSIYQPLASGLTSIAGASSTGSLYYLSGTNVWSAVTVGSGLSFTTGTLAATPASTEAANLVYAGPASGSAATPGFRALVVADIPSISSLLPSQSGHAGQVFSTNGTLPSWTSSPTAALALVGVTSGSAATAGNVGEVISSTVGSGSAVSLTTATATNITSIMLTAGDWDVEGNINFALVAATTTATEGGVSLSSNTMPADGTEVYSGVLSTIVTDTDGLTLPRKVVNVSSTTTVYLVGEVTFSAGTAAGFGSITARRVR